MHHPGKSVCDRPSSGHHKPPQRSPSPRSNPTPTKPTEPKTRIKGRGRLALQQKSWFKPTDGWAADGGKVVGQIFFPTGGARLDHHTDKVVLNAIASWYLAEALQREHGFQLRCVGHADPRGNDKFNQRLALQRARNVSEHLKALVRRALGPMHRATMYPLTFKPQSLGEVGATGHLILDRRVDIIQLDMKTQRHKFNPSLIEGTVPGTDRLEFEVLGGGSADPLPVIQFVSIPCAFQNMATGETVRYTFYGSGLGGSIPLSGGSSKRTNAFLPKNVTIHDLAGNGHVVQSSTGSLVHSTYAFEGPRRRGLMQKDLKFEFRDKVDMQLGQATHNILMGEWKHGTL